MLLLKEREEKKTRLTGLKQLANKNEFKGVLNKWASDGLLITWTIYIIFMRLLFFFFSFLLFNLLRNWNKLTRCVQSLKTSTLLVSNKRKKRSKQRSYTQKQRNVKQKQNEFDKNIPTVFRLYVKKLKRVTYLLLIKRNTWFLQI